MQMQAWFTEALANAVDIVADNWESHRRAMHAQLMGAAGDRFQRQPCEAVAAPHHTPARLRWQSIGVWLLPPAAHGIGPPERNDDFAFVLRRAAYAHGPIGLADLAVLEQQPERGGRLAVAAEHEAAGGVAVEPMREHRRAR